ncbi:MAG: Zn-ribbon domain-containing OB-fold protein [Calditrichales bacterium]|nr:MAG: Zn-ribbon domain-containing OB-fold protein [Calditrichales bacterium]
MIVPRYTREIPHRMRLEAGKCKECGYIAFPRRLVCPQCGKRAFDKINLKPQGKILTFTIIHIAADDFSTQVPFAVAVIETVEGARLTAQVVDCRPQEVEIGKKVRLMTRLIQKEGHAGILQYGYKAVLERN